MSRLRPTTIDDSERRLEADVAEWTARADALVRAKFADAAAHARRAVTNALRAEADGRPTLRKASASPSTRAAAARLDELRTALIGPRKDSLDGLLRDARAAFYRDAFDWVAPYLVAGVHRMDGRPTDAGADVARGAVIHGYDLAAEFAALFAQSASTLSACLNLAGARDASPRTADVLLGAWEDKRRRAVSNRCRLVLGDSARALLWAVEQALVLPTRRS